MLNGVQQLCKYIFNFLNIDTVFIDADTTIKVHYGLTKIPETLSPYFAASLNYLKINEANSDFSVLFHSTSYRQNYISAKMYDGDKYFGSIIIGPYLLEEPSILMLESIISENNMAISLKNIVKQYYQSLPLISTYKAADTAEFLSYLVSTFDSNCFSISNIGKLDYDFKTEDSVSNDIIKESTENTMEALERRYNIENAMLHSIEIGDLALYDKLLRENSSSFTNIPDRIPNDPLRSAKNSGFVLNTLLRKAAEKGGLHPIYLDSLSSKYAVQIEKSSSFNELSEVYRGMQVCYCDTVRKLSLKTYSPPIRKAIEFIRINLNQDLTLEVISEAIHLSPFELSRQFKKEAGESITEYINKRRINEALYILENHNVSITDTSYMVGFNDVNYFTRVFKKLKGLTPTEYRKGKI